MARHPANWSLTNVDTEETFEGQFPLERGIRAELGAELGVATPHSAEDAIVQWTGGKSKTFSFGTTLFAATEDEAVELNDIYRKLESFAMRNDKVRRAPILLFQYGTGVINTLCMIDRFNPTFGMVYDSGFPQRIDIDISLRKYVPFRHATLDPTRRPPSTRVLNVSRAARSYEEIARQEYGDPLLGDRLRKRNPRQPLAPDPGDKLLLPPESTIRREMINPSFHAFSRVQEDALALVQDTIALRALETLRVS